MFNPEEGWAFGSNGMVFHYTRAPGETNLTWQRAPSLDAPLYAITDVAMISPNEGWGIDGSWIFHYKDGVAVYPSSSTGAILLDI